MMRNVNAVWFDPVAGLEEEIGGGGTYLCWLRRVLYCMRWHQERFADQQSCLLKAVEIKQDNMLQLQLNDQDWRLTYDNDQSSPYAIGRTFSLLERSEIEETKNSCGRTAGRSPSLLYYSCENIQELFMRALRTWSE